MQPILFLSHGGGPLPLLGDPGHAGMVEAFARIRQTLQALPKKPEVLLFISAHWEAPCATITDSESPPLYYDYYGFPDEAYSIRYSVSGAPQTAGHIFAQLTDVGIQVATDSSRGLDHGVFVPGLMLFPEADIPCLQLSLIEGLSPQAHLHLGDALQSLRARDVMIIGSGFSFHNMREFFGPGSPDADTLNREFEGWLSDTLMKCDNPTRRQRLLEWQTAPGARFCHPREEHLMPLHVCVGAASDNQASLMWQFEVLGRQGSCYLWS